VDPVPRRAACGCDRRASFPCAVRHPQLAARARSLDPCRRELSLTRERANKRERCGREKKKCVDSQHPVQMKRQTGGYGMGWLSGPGFLSLLVAFFFLFLNSKTHRSIILFHKMPYRHIHIGWILIPVSVSVLCSIKEFRSPAIF
jgi:hypothetical protein